MKIVTKTYNVYGFSELSQDAQDKAIDDMVKFLLEIEDETIQPAIDRAEELLTPWFAGQLVWEMHKDYVIESCSGYEYLGDGSVFSE